MLLQLEARQWDMEQAATEDVLRARLMAHPTLCVGTFCTRTGEALTSLFMQPVDREKMQKVRSWSDCAGSGQAATESASRSLFGISLTSVDPAAVAALEAYIWPLALRSGWREIYLGSPMPGLRAALSQDPGLSAHAYAHAKRRHLPRDPQLRYYYQKGLRDIVAVLPGYFPHGDALDYGVLLRGDMKDIAACAQIAVACGAADLLMHEMQVEEDACV